jgi:hypothetical protein
MNNTTEQTPVKPAPLSMQKANEIAGAIARRFELKGTKIVTKENEAELRGLDQFLSNALTEHVEELLGCWFTIRREYEPLLQTFAQVAYRVGAIINRQAPAAQP